MSSIRDIDVSPGLFSDGPWGKALVEIEGMAVSLDDIDRAFAEADTAAKEPGPVTRASLVMA